MFTSESKSSLYLSLLLLLLWTDSATAQWVDFHWTSPVKDRFVIFYAEPKDATPALMAILVEPDDPDPKFQIEWEREALTNHNLLSKQSGKSIFDAFEKVVWVPFQTNILVDLGPGDGQRRFVVDFKDKNNNQLQQINPSIIKFDGHRLESHPVVVQSSPLLIGITNPKRNITSQPIIQLSGFYPVLFESVRYEVLNQDGKITAHGEGLSIDKYYDTGRHLFTTNYFCCFDVGLSFGTNQIVLSCEDFAGNKAVTNLTYVLNLEQDKTPPVISLKWPKPGMVIANNSFDAYGSSDDPTAHLVAEISANDHTNTVIGMVRRDGVFGVYGLPLSVGSNVLTLTATDAAGNSSQTNLLIYGGEGVVITMDPFQLKGQSSKDWITVTGKVHPAIDSVWVNGVRAEVKPDGTWIAKHIPDNRLTQTSFLFEMSATPPEVLITAAAQPKGLITAQVSLDTNTIILNASFPAHGVFQLHATGTANHSFVLEASTNLVEWIPILTNSSPNPTFDYTDTNANSYLSRFFRVVPLQ